jgi:hypothetical protein
VRPDYIVCATGESISSFSGRYLGQPGPGDSDCSRQNIAAQVAAAQTLCSHERGAAAAEEVGDEVSTTRAGADHAIKECERLLSGPAAAFFRDRREEWDIPHVGECRTRGVEIELPSPGGLVGAAGLVDPQAVGAIDAFAKDIESVSPGRLGIEQDCVVLTAEPAPGGAARAIVPDNLVEEVFPPKDGIELDLDVVGRPPIEMCEKKAVRSEQAMALEKSRMKKSKIRLEPAGPAVRVAMRPGGRRALAVAAERWIDIDQIAAVRRKGLHEGQVVASVKG